MLCFSPKLFLAKASLLIYTDAIGTMTLQIWGGGGLLPYMGCIGICGAKGYGFSAALVINRVSILAILPQFW